MFPHFFFFKRNFPLMGTHSWACKMGRMHWKLAHFCLWGKISNYSELANGNAFVKVLWGILPPCLVWSPGFDTVESPHEDPSPVPPWLCPDQREGPGMSLMRKEKELELKLTTRPMKITCISIAHVVLMSSTLSSPPVSTSCISTRDLWGWGIMVSNS